MEYNQSDWKTKLAKSWKAACTTGKIVKTTGTTGQKRYPSLVLQLLRLENKDSQILKYSLYDWKTKIVKYWITTSTIGRHVLEYNLYDSKKNIASLGIQHLRLDAMFWNTASTIGKQTQPSPVIQPVRLENKDTQVFEYSLYDWKPMKANKEMSWITTYTTGKQRYPYPGLQPVQLESKCSLFLNYNMYDCKTKIAKSWNITCTIGSRI